LNMADAVIGVVNCIAWINVNKLIP
jgi:hypothetical protein